MFIEFRQVAHLRNGRQMIAPEVPAFSLHAALLVCLARRTKLCFESPMRSKRDEADRLLTLRSAEDSFHRSFQVVVAQAPEYTSEPVQCQLVCLQKRLLCRVQIRAMETSAARHA